MDIKDLRGKLGITQKEMALCIGVSISTVSRWEANISRPSPLAVEKLRELKIDYLDGKFQPGRWVNADAKLTEGCPKKFIFNGNVCDCEVMPYVINGPKDQDNFYEKIIKIQQHKDSELPWDIYKKRLSLLKSIEGVATAQFELEAPSNKRKSWSSNYGTHGWHRYVGRFPPHLVRALLNRFGARKDDVILDPFCGSGTTLVEARLLGIDAKGVEISPLSALISMTKSKFPSDADFITPLAHEMELFYKRKMDSFLRGRKIDEVEFDEIISREGNKIHPFVNYSKWFSKEALLGCSIVVEYIDGKNDGYGKNLLQVALSSKMRSIGNVDVDVVRAEYRKKPRTNVNVLRLMTLQLRKMQKDIHRVMKTHSDMICSQDSIKVIQGNILDVDFEEESVSHIITSPPYGVESISYLRTHLLSFRVLESFLGVDPYNFGEGVIGSEFLDGKMLNNIDMRVSTVSKKFKDFFDGVLEQVNKDPRHQKRVMMMMQFFEDINCVIEKLNKWLKRGGYVGFVIGNKKVGDVLIPTDIILREIFEKNGFIYEDEINHKLKTNNSNSVVPWQDRIIENEYVQIYKKG